MFTESQFGKSLCIKFSCFPIPDQLVKYTKKYLPKKFQCTHREIFTVRSIREILTIDDCNMDERLESSLHLVYYQVSGEPGIACCSCRLDNYSTSGSVDLHASLFTDHCRVI